MKTVFFSVGEPSGDLHGANLICALRELRSDVRCVGYGGPRMAAAGCELHEDLTRFAVMWIAKVITNLPTFLRLLARANRFFREHKPDAVVLIDYPGFNWWIARRAKAHGIPVIYYGAPQLWAWAGWRVRKMRRLTDHVLCKLPFEEDWFRSRGCDAHYVGHPYFDELASRKLDEAFIQADADQHGPLLTLLPGSRDQEVTSNLPALLETAQIVKQQMPDLRIAVANFNGAQQEMSKQLIAESGCRGVETHVARTPELIHLSDCCVACSGSVSLELMYHRKPAVIHYAIGRFAYALQDRFRTARYITLVNLLAADSISRRSRELVDGGAAEPFPEFVTCTDESKRMAEEVLRRLQNAKLCAKIFGQLDQLCNAYGAAGASERAAQFIAKTLGDSDFLTVAAPHLRRNAPRRLPSNVAAD